MEEAEPQVEEEEVPVQTKCRRHTKNSMTFLWSISSKVLHHRKSNELVVVKD